MGGRRRGSRGLVTRRSVLMATGAGLAGTGVTGTGAFTRMTGGRGSAISVVSDRDGYVGLYVYDQVEKNSRDPLVDITNNYDHDVSITVTLVDCTEGTIYAPNGDSGCSATANVPAGDTRTWKIESAVGNNTTVAFDVNGSSAHLSFSARRSTTAVNKSSNAVKIKRFQLGKPVAVDTNQDQFEIKEIRIVDNDNDDDIVRRQFTVTDGNGNTIALNDSQDDPDRTFAETAEWREKNITLQADENLTGNETYNIKLTGYDSDDDGDGNYDNINSETKTV